MPRHICTRCGHDNARDATFCRDCGAVLDWQREPEEADAVPAEAADGGLFAPVPPRGQRVERPVRSRKLGLAARLSQTELTVDPGAAVDCDVRVRNEGTVVDRALIEVLGPAARWASCEPQSLNLLPDAEGVVTVRFTPPRAPEPAAGPAPFEVRVTSGEDPSVVVAGHGTVEVTPFLEVTGELVPSLGQGRRRAGYRVSLTNRGNRPVHLAVRARCPDERLQLAVSDPSLACDPGGSVTTSIDARAPRLAIVEPPPRQRFTVTADENGAPIYQGEAAFQQQRLLPKAVLTALLALFSVVALAGLAALVFGGGDGDITVPTLVGQSRDVAEARLTDAGLRLDQVLGQESGETPGTVLAQDPSPGTTVERGTAVDIAVAVPADAGLVAVPDLTGRSRAEAEGLLAAQDLLLGQVVEQASAAPPGSVIQQEPPAGAEVQAGTPVAIAVAVRVVSSGVDVLHGTFSFDLDAGGEAPQQQGAADLFWRQQTQSERQLQPIGQAQVANLGNVSFDGVGLADLQAAPFSDAAVEGSDGNDQMPVGTVLAVRTNAGNLAKVQIVERDVPSPDGRTSIQNIRIAWQTFEPLP